MRNFQDTFETHEPSFISAFSICMTAPLREMLKHADPKYEKNSVTSSMTNVKF